MEFKRNFQDSLLRWRAFWQHSMADRPPLVIRTRQWDIADGSKPRIKAKPMAFEERFEGDYIRCSAAGAEARFTQRLDVLDDTFPHISGPGGLAVTGWLFGANVETVAGTSWVEPVLERIEDWQTIDFDAAREKYNRILECYRILAEESRGQYAIGAGVLEGPADMAVRMLGEEKLALALYEQPEMVQALFSFLAKLGREFAEKKLDIIPEYGGGTVSSGYWTLGKGVGIQEDFGQMVSPLHFREIVLKQDCTLHKNLDNAWFHVHSGGLHMAREIVDNGVFGCIQITNDYPAGPSAREMLPTLQYIQKRSCLILRKLSLDQLDNIIGHLSPEGLAIDIQCLDSTATKDIQTTIMTHEEAEQVIQWAEKWIKQRRNSPSN